VRQRKRMLQEAVDALFDNGRRGRVLRGPTTVREVALRHAQGQARPLPPESAWQARRLLWTFPSSRRSRTQAAPVRTAKKMALELSSHSSITGSTDRQRSPNQQAKENGGAAGASFGNILEEVIKIIQCLLTALPRASPRHSSVRTGPGGRQSHSHSPAGLHRVQRGFRRRSDGCPHSAFSRKPKSKPAF